MNVAPRVAQEQQHAAPDPDQQFWTDVRQCLIMLQEVAPPRYHRMIRAFISAIERRWGLSPVQPPRREQKRQARAAARG